MGYRSSGGGEPTPEMLDAIAKRHAQNTDTALDEGGTDEVTAAEAKAASDHATGDGSDHADVGSNTAHRGTTSGNPHAVTAAEVGAHSRAGVEALVGRTAKPSGTVRVVSVDEVSVSAQLKSTTGYVGVRWWDGTVQIVGDGVAGNTQVAHKNVPTWGNAWSGPAPKEICFWSVGHASTPSMVGELTYFALANDGIAAADVSGVASLQELNLGTNKLSSIDLSGLTALTALDLNANNLTSVDLSDLTALTTLTIRANPLTSIDLAGLTALTEIDLSFSALTSFTLSGLPALDKLELMGNSLTSVDLSALPALTHLRLDANSLTSVDLSDLTALQTLYLSDNSLAALDVSGLLALESLFCDGNALGSLDVSGLSSLTWLDCSDNALTSLRAIGVVLSYYMHSMWHGVQASEIVNNNLDAAALDQFYTDLGVDAGATGYIDVSGNPGTSGDDPSIATAKGYTIAGS